MPPHRINSVQSCTYSSDLSYPDAGHLSQWIILLDLAQHLSLLNSDFVHNVNPLNFVSFDPSYGSFKKGGVEQQLPITSLYFPPEWYRTIYEHSLGLAGHPAKVHWTAIPYLFTLAALTWEDFTDALQSRCTPSIAFPWCSSSVNISEKKLISLTWFVLYKHWFQETILPTVSASSAEWQVVEWMPSLVQALTDW